MTSADNDRAPLEAGPPRPRQAPRPTTRHETERPVAPRVAAPPEGPASQRVRPRGGPPAPRGVR
jgi:hypothetical protein